MTARMMAYLIDSDFTATYAVLVWIGVFLAVGWAILMREDPANRGLPEWDLRLRRSGIIIMVAGFLLTVLFAGDQGWAPWPTMLLTIFGFDFYMGAALITASRRRAHHLKNTIALDHRMWN